MNTNEFEKSKGRRALPYIVLLVVCAAVLAVWAFGWLGGNLGIGTHYANAQAYTAGGTTLTDLPRSLEIDWLDGRVRIAWHAEQTVEIRETSRKPIPGNLEVRWWMDGETLRIRYAQSGASTFMKDLDKELTVTLPEGLALQNVRISGTSADVDIPSLTADSLRLDSTSGDIRFTAAAGQAAVDTTSGGVQGTVTGASKIGISTTSGGIGLVQNGRTDSISLHSTSGGVALQMEDAGDAVVSTTSGGIAVQADSVDRLRLTTTSGGAAVQLAAFRDLAIDCTSGDVTAALPAEPGFSGKISTTSGSVTCDLPLSCDGNTYSCGDGSGKISINTTSGNVRIR